MMQNYKLNVIISFNSQNIEKVNILKSKNRKQ